jgi:hypothetical protein
MADQVIFVWYSSDRICGIMHVNIPQEYKIILLVSDYRKFKWILTSSAMLSHSKICRHDKSLQHGVLFK